MGLRRGLTWLLFLTVMLSGCAGQKKPPSPTGGEPTLKVWMHRTGEIQEMKLEEYLLGVVAGEMAPEWPVEALAAQAILARTFTLERMERGGPLKERGVDASTNEQEFQAYNGDKVNDNVKKAVAQTRGLVARYQGQYIQAFYHADSGGKTATAWEGLNYSETPTPYLQVVDDPGPAVSPEENKAWRVSVPLSEVRQQLKQRTGQDPGPLQAGSIAVLERGPSGRVTKIRVGQATISGSAFRLSLDSERVRSTLLEGLAVEGGQLVLKGKGFGHGVGMSQYGAKKLAADGKKAREIIAYFLPGVQVEQAWR